ncbi:MAG: glutaminyl-peptide cyclotransferase [Anaerolineae bacterium]|nr:glutaminyl-peptide cyclotransferase [Anaerolineae bacterium]
MLPALDAYTPRSANWGQPDGPAPVAEDFEPVRLRPEVLNTVPHDSTSFTQGLLFHEGSLFESDGNCCPSYSTFSTLREVNPETGEVLRSIDLDPQYFAEGLERVDDRLIQLTWQAGVAFVYDIETFDVVDTYDYEGEGWGLCYDGSLLYMSDGSSYITLRDPETFEVVDRGLVTFQGLPADQINELECVGDYIYANIWQAEVIIQIDKTNGNVVAVIDAQGLLSEEQLAGIEAGSDVLNGIVYLPESDTFLITGKHWPAMFEVEFVEMEAPAE